MILHVDRVGPKPLEALWLGTESMEKQAYGEDDLKKR
jgi:hypothetical protein